MYSVVSIQLQYLCFYSVPIDCVVSEWSAWTQPDEGGNVESFRTIRVKPLNNGMKCPDLWQKKKGEFGLL